MFTDEPASIPLTGPAGGIDSFCVEGAIDGTHAHAEWDGRWVIATQALLVRAELAMAVDDVFAEMPGVPDVALPSQPERLLRGMLVACDSIAVAEFTHHGRQRVVTRSYPAALDDEAGQIDTRVDPERSQARPPT
jgi:hypothetical protein